MGGARFAHVLKTMPFNYTIATNRWMLSVQTGTACGKNLKLQARLQAELQATRRVRGLRIGGMDIGVSGQLLFRWPEPY